MKTATFTEFRQHAKAYFDYVENGETIRILRHDKVIAKIVPADEDKNIPSWKQSGPRLTIKGISLRKVIFKQRKKGR